MLTPDPPHKPGQPRQSVDDRLSMLHIMISDYPQFALSRVDIERSPPLYAVDTVRVLAQVYPQAELLYLIGGDLLRDLPTWHDPAGLLHAASALGVMRRPDDGVDLASLEARLPGLSAKIQNHRCTVARDLILRDPQAHPRRAPVPSLPAGGRIFSHPRASALRLFKRLKLVSLTIRKNASGCCYLCTRVPVDSFFEWNIIVLEQHCSSVSSEVASPGNAWRRKLSPGD